MLRLKREPIYTLTDPNFEGFQIKLTKKGWWLDQNKLQQIIDSAKAGETQKKAMVRAGITKKQWDRFNDVHYTFKNLWRRCVDNVKYPKHYIDHLYSTPPDILEKYECKEGHYFVDAIILIPKKN